MDLYSLAVDLENFSNNWYLVIVWQVYRHEWSHLNRIQKSSLASTGFSRSVGGLYLPVYIWSNKSVISVYRIAVFGPLL